MKVLKPLPVLLLAGCLSGGAQADPAEQPLTITAFTCRHRPAYLALWATLPADSRVEEVAHNFFIRQPVLWEPVCNNKSRS